MKNLTYLSVFSTLLFLFSCSSDENTPPVDKSENRLSVGVSANYLLDDTKYQNLVLDIVYVKGNKPADISINGLIDFLKLYTNKTTITYTLTAVASPGITKYNLKEDMPDLEDKLRTEYNEDNTITAFIFFADGSSENEEGDSVTLGAAYWNTSIIIFEKTIINLSKNSGVAIADIETATLQHEFGHLLGLVNLGSAMQSDHEDTAFPHHCNIDGCLMEAEIQFSAGLTSRLKTGKGTLTLDAACIADLQSNGGK